VESSTKSLEFVGHLGEHRDPEGDILMIDRGRTWRIAGRLTLAAVGVLVVAGRAEAAGPFQATGIKIGEVTDHSAIVWARLTQKETRNPKNGPMVEIEYQRTETPEGRREREVKAIRFPDGATVADLREAVPGVDGDVRVLWKEAAQNEWQKTPWRKVNPRGDFARQFELVELNPAAAYQVRVESRSVEGKAGQTVDGKFRTAPHADDERRVVFAAATCFGNDDQDSPDGFRVYRAMGKLDPDFFVHTGDIIYYDELAKTIDLARYHWQRTYSWPTNVEFHRDVASYFIKDDHDTWRNDCWPTMESPYMGDFTFRQGQAVFREQVPMGPSTYRSFRWGKDLQVWLVEGRDFRSPNTMSDGPKKSIWGAKQKQWFKDTVDASDATFRVLISPTPLVGPDRSTKADNHANEGFAHEGQELRAFLGERKMIAICGDRHWQFMSVDPESKVREYSSGPGSDSHAGGWQQSDYRPEVHRFLRVAGGFLSVTVERKDGKPTMTLRFHDVDGAVKFSDVVAAR
jgi:alkaline phosphatase D